MQVFALPKLKRAPAMRGNPHIKTALVETAWSASRTKHSEFQERYQRLKHKLGYKRALVACAHALVIRIYEVLDSGTPYHAPASHAAGPGSAQVVASVNTVGEKPPISMVAPIAGSSTIEPFVKTELVFPTEVTVNGWSVNDVVPRVPVAIPEKVSDMGLPNATVAVNPRSNETELNRVFMVARAYHF
jgi:hypothetical protein